MAHVPGIVLNRRLILGSAWVAWLLFVASFLMPVARDMNMPGWRAFWFYLSEQLKVLNFLQEIQNEPLNILTTTFAGTNGSMFIAPVILWRWPRWSGWLGFLLAGGGLVPLVLYHQMIAEEELRIGFYCWVDSILLMAGLSWWTFLAHRRSATNA